MTSSSRTNNNFNCTKIPKRIVFLVVGMILFYVTQVTNLHHQLSWYGYDATTNNPSNDNDNTNGENYYENQPTQIKLTTSTINRASSQHHLPGDDKPLLTTTTTTSSYSMRKGSDIILDSNYVISNQNNQSYAKQLLEISLLKDLPHPNMNCTIPNDGSHKIQQCCVPWSINVDEWWMHHPDWRVSYEDHLISCFSKYEDPNQAKMMRQLYQLQWTTWKDDKTDDNIYDREELPPSTRTCRNLYQSFQILSGVGATVPMAVGNLFEATQRRHQPYQLARRNSNRNFWMYVSPNRTNWSYCPTRDLRCFILPISNCVSLDGNHGGKTEDEYNQYRIEHWQKLSSPYHSGKQNRLLPRRKYSQEYISAQYVLRFKHSLRHRIQQILHQKQNDQDRRDKIRNNDANTVERSNCTIMHVRRGDKAVSLAGYARYAGLIEYIEAAHVQQDDPILLLTDDVSTIVELDKYYPDYKWDYFDFIPRKNMSQPAPNKGGKLGWEGHVVDSRINEDSPGHEFAIIWAEVLWVASHYCSKLVVGKTHFTEIIQMAYAMMGRIQPKLVRLDLEITEAQATQYDNISSVEIAYVYLDKIYKEAEQLYNERMAK